MPHLPITPPRKAGEWCCAVAAATWSAAPPMPSSLPHARRYWIWVGKDTLKQLPALLARADLVVTPDSGPMHIANAMGTKVLGLHAASNPLRSGPYSDVRYCVDRYDAAACKFLHKPADQLSWGTKIEFDDVMSLITVDDAIAAFERYRTDHPR